MNLYPNPANDYLIVENHSNVMVSEINIVDMNGKMVKVINAWPIEVGPSRIDISELNKGAYIFRAITQEGVFAKVFVKD